MWLEDVVQKRLRKHAVTQKEVAEVFVNRPSGLLKRDIVSVKMSVVLLARQVLGVT